MYGCDSSLQSHMTQYDGAGDKKWYICSYEVDGSRILIGLDPKPKFTADSVCLAHFCIALGNVTEFPQRFVKAPLEAL